MADIALDNRPLSATSCLEKGTAVLDIMQPIASVFFNGNHPACHRHTGNHLASSALVVLRPHDGNAVGRKSLAGKVPRLHQDSVFPAFVSGRRSLINSRGNLVAILLSSMNHSGQRPLTECGLRRGMTPCLSHARDFNRSRASRQGGHSHG